MNTYGSLNLTVTSPEQSFTEPITLTEAKQFLNLPDRSPTDEAEDAEIEGMITAAREIAETEQGRDLVEKQWDLSLDYFPCVIELRSPLVSVDLVQYKDSDGNVTALVADTDYIVDTAKQPGVIMPAYGESWPSFTPWPSSAVTVRHTAGFSATAAFWSDSGARVRIGMKMLISEWWNNRLPLSYDISSGGSVTVDRILSLLRSGSLVRVR
jgi:uncharacterized phiE125 gp8 family phage protein